MSRLTAQGICSVKLRENNGTILLKEVARLGVSLGCYRLAATQPRRRLPFPGHQGTTSRAPGLPALHLGTTPCAKPPYSLASSCPIHLGCLEGRLRVEKRAPGQSAIIC